MPSKSIIYKRLLHRIGIDTIPGIVTVRGTIIYKLLRRFLFNILNNISPTYIIYVHNIESIHKIISSDYILLFPYINNHNEIKYIIAGTNLNIEYIIESLLKSLDINIDVLIRNNNKIGIEIDTIQLDIINTIWIKNNSSLFIINLTNIIRTWGLWETVARVFNGLTPSLPLWLAPVQVRLIPLGKPILGYAESICDIFLREAIRCDIDDLWRRLGDRIRRAAGELIPYIVLIGEREEASGTINIRERVSNNQFIMDTGEFAEMLVEKLKGYPRLVPELPRRLSQKKVW